MKLKIFFLSLLCPFFLFAQEGRLKYANKLYNSHQYVKAKEAYLDVLQRTDDSLQVAEKIALSYDKSGDVSHAVLWYNYILKKGVITKEHLFRKAYLEKLEGNYKAANHTLRKYLSTYGNNPSVAALILSDNDIKKLTKMNPEFDIKGKFVHTSASDIGTTFFSENEVLITSSQRRKWAVNRTYGRDGGYFYNLYQASINNEGELVSDLSIINGKVNTQFHDGMGSYDKKNNFLYFTRDNFLQGEGKGYNEDHALLLCIYRAKVEFKNGKITIDKAENLPFNSKEYSCSHPSISKDGKHLYFASNMPGGKGGVDIYSVVVNEDGTFGKPINLGNKINTPLDDEFPFYKQDEKLLYFASNGHKGLGGLDVFVAHQDSLGGFYNVSNLQSPINSHWDDFSFSNDPSGRFGYFSSNRATSDDVYRFIQHKQKSVTGNVRDFLTNNNLDSALIVLKNKEGKSLDSAWTNEEGNYKMILPDSLNEFHLFASRRNYFPEQKSLTVQQNSFDYTVNFQLKPMKYQFVASVKDDASNIPIPDVDALVINLKGDTLFQGKSDSLGHFMVDLQNVKFGDSIHLQIRLTKDGYISKTIPFNRLLGKNPTLQADFKMTKIILGKTDLADVVDLDPVYFDLNSSFFNRSDAKADMRKVVKILKENPTMKIAIKGNCDQRGSYRYNVWLSNRRAKRAYSYLLAHGIRPSAIVSVKGYSYDRPKVSQAKIDAAPSQEEKEKLYQLNRRTEFIIVSMK